MRRNLNKLSVKYQSLTKSREIDAFEQQYCIYWNPCHDSQSHCAILQWPPFTKCVSNYYLFLFIQITLVQSTSHRNGSLHCFELWETYTVPNLEKSKEAKVGQWVSIEFNSFLFYIKIWQSVRIISNYKNTALFFLI